MTLDTIDIHLGRRPDESTEQAADRVRAERDAAVAALATARLEIARLRGDIEARGRLGARWFDHGG